MLTFTHREYLTEQDMKDIYAKLRNSGMYRTVFCAKQRPTYESWINYIDNETWMVRVTEEGRDIAGFWLTDFYGKTAFLHYWIYREAWVRTEEIGFAVLNWIEEYVPSVDRLIGKTPATNKLAVGYLEKMGFKELCKIKDFMTLENGYDTAIISNYELRGKP